MTPCQTEILHKTKPSGKHMNKDEIFLNTAEAGGPQIQDHHIWVGT
jgi:hypothetical protein